MFAPAAKKVDESLNKTTVRVNIPLKKGGTTIIDIAELMPKDKPEEMDIEISSEGSSEGEASEDDSSGIEEVDDDDVISTLSRLRS